MKDVDTRAVYHSFISSVRFFFHNGPRLIAVSVTWFVCSLPLFTVGPATLGAYVAILSLREDYRIDTERVWKVLKRHGISAALLTGIPFVLLAIAALYVRQYFATQSTVALALGVFTVNAAAYVAHVLVPTFVALAAGTDLTSALREAVTWTARNGTGAVTMGMATLLVFGITAVLTIAFVVVFAGLTFTFHLETVLKPPRENVEGKSVTWIPNN